MERPASSLPLRVVSVAEFDVPDQFPAASAVLSANQYVLLACSPATVKDSAFPALLGVGSPATCVARFQLDSVIAPDVK